MGVGVGSGGLSVCGIFFLFFSIFIGYICFIRSLLLRFWINIIKNL